MHSAFAQGLALPASSHPPVDISRTAFNPFGRSPITPERTVASPSQPPFVISNPEHLNRFIGALVGASQDNAAAPSLAATTVQVFVLHPSECAQNTATSEEKPLTDSKEKTLSLTEKILLIADFDAGETEEELAGKYGVSEDSVSVCSRRRRTGAGRAVEPRFRDQGAGPSPTGQEADPCEEDALCGVERDDV